MSILVHIEIDNKTLLPRKVETGLVVLHIDSFAGVSAVDPSAIDTPVMELQYLLLQMVDHVH
jgi:hypothetical protein